MAEKKIVEHNMEDALESIKLMFARFQNEIDVAEAFLYIRELFV